MPRLINKIAKLCLKAGETNNFDTISGEVVQQIGDRFGKMTGPAVQRRRVKETPVPQGPKKEAAGEAFVQEKPVRTSEPAKKEAPFFVPPPPPPSPSPTETMPEIIVTYPPAEPILTQPEIIAEGLVIEGFEEEIEKEFGEPVFEKAAPPPLPQETFSGPVPEGKTVQPMETSIPQPEIPKEAPVVEGIEEKIIERAAPPPPPPPQDADVLFPQAGEEAPKLKAVVHPLIEIPPETEEDRDMAIIAGHKIKIDIAPHIIEQTHSVSIEQRRKVAGVLAAQTLEKNPQLTASPTVDPVSVWSDILSVIMKRLE